MRCTICYHLYNFKNVKNTHGGVLPLVNLQADIYIYIYIHTQLYTVEQETVFPHAMAGKSVKYLLLPTPLSTGLRLKSSFILRKLMKIGILFQRIDVTSDYFNVMFFLFV